ncbi:MAG: DNA-deoxyinosine glycosylase [Clostridia bacterium]|nr:DNA-deoxyinosine glycosylase [Clostridia bacterium]
MRIEHPIPPLYDENSRVLILGSFPSAASREARFFYGHPQNRFWRVLAALYGEDAPGSVGEKRAFLLGHGIALWDVIASCEIRGSADSSVRDARPNDLSPILRGSRVERIFANGRLSYTLYTRFQEKETGVPAVYLPSTSPANAAFGLEKLVEAWKVIL